MMPRLDVPLYDIYHCVSTCKLHLFPSLCLPSIPSLYRQKRPIESNVNYENNNPPVTHSEKKDEDDFTSTDASKLVRQNLNPELDEEQQWQGKIILLIVSTKQMQKPSETRAISCLLLIYSKTGCLRTENSVIQGSG